MGILLTIIFGALVGWVASIITGRDVQQGWIANIVIGIVGSFIGGWLGAYLNGYSSLRFDLIGLIWSLVGAIALCVAINLLTTHRVRP